MINNRDGKEKWLMPGNSGRDCLCDGKHGEKVNCEECVYLKCCLDENFPDSCTACRDLECPRQAVNGKCKL